MLFLKNVYICQSLTQPEGSHILLIHGLMIEWFQHMIEAMVRVKILLNDIELMRLLGFHSLL